MATPDGHVRYVLSEYRGCLDSGAARPTWRRWKDLPVTVAPKSGRSHGDGGRGKRRVWAATACWGCVPRRRGPAVAARRGTAHLRRPPQDPATPHRIRRAAARSAGTAAQATPPAPRARHRQAPVELARPPDGAAGGQKKVG